jgi:hypothetical protein
MVNFAVNYFSIQLLIINKVRKQLFFISIALISVIFSSCKTMQIEKPKESYLPSNLPTVISELPLKAEIDVKKLETSINKKMSGVIFEGTNLSDKDLSVRVSKAQNFTFSINNNVIEYRVPLKVWSRFSWKVEKFGISVGDFYEANGSIALTYKTTISIDKNWKLVSKTASSGYEWIEAPKLSVAGVNVPVTPIASLALSRCDKLISDQIDKSLADAVDLKKYIGQAWSEVQKPRQANAENDLWLRITPKDVYISPFSSVGNKLNIAVALYAQIESFMGAKPAANALVALPPFKQVNRPAQQFNLNIGTDVTFAKISEMAKKELLNKTFTQGNKAITITDLSIFGSDEKAVFVVDVIGSLKGRIYFKGNMIYNPEKMAVEITNPEFDVKTSNALVKSAGWLLHGMILKQISPYLTYPVKDDLEKMKTEVNQMMSNFSIMDGVSLQGKLNSISVMNLNLVPGALRIQANVKGNVALKVDDLKF